VKENNGDSTPVKAKVVSIDALSVRADNDETEHDAEPPATDQINTKASEIDSDPVEANQRNKR